MTTQLLSHQQQVVIDERITPIANGLEVTLDKEAIFEYNYPNYDLCDIVVNELTLQADPYNPEIHGNEVTGYGKCSFDGSTFPEAVWEHIPGNFFQLIINQAGKAAQSVTTTLNGIALRSAKSENRKPTHPHNLEFIKKSRVFIKAGQVFVRAKFDFFQDSKKVAHYETLSIGMERDYSELIKLKGDASLIGQRLVSARALTPAQCKRLLKQQADLKSAGMMIRLGELAVEQGYCVEQEVRECLKIEN